jgi:hypothetical protein
MILRLGRDHDWLTKSLRETLLERGISPRFVHNVIEPITRVIYNQDASMNAYAGLFAVDIILIRTYNVASGNEVMPQKLVEGSGAEVKLSTVVESITRGSNVTI